MSSRCYLVSVHPLTFSLSAVGFSAQMSFTLEELREKGRLVVSLNGHTICLLAEGDEVYAVDNRCPHMGFPLHRGTVSDGILTCHWHHARFDLCTGGTFDQFADELRRFPVEIDGDDILVDVRPPTDPLEHQHKRL